MRHLWEALQYTIGNIVSELGEDVELESLVLLKWIILRNLQESEGNEIQDGTLMRLSI